MLELPAYSQRFLKQGMDIYSNIQKVFDGGEIEFIEIDSIA